MCGIIAYVGDRLCKNIILEGLARLEYRGYDSAGFVCIDAKHNHFSSHKEAGGLGPIKRLANAIDFDGHIGMGHTRWATHGVVDLKNAHPHFNCNKSLAVVHNGIIEGHETLRSKVLAGGHTLNSTTDTELVVHLFNDEIEELSNLRAAALALVKQIGGAYAFVFIHEQTPDTLIVIRHRSPLVIGHGINEMFVGSDFIAFADKTSQFTFMPDDSIALIKKDRIELFDFNGNDIAYTTQTIDTSKVDLEKNAFEQDMLKEIYEQKRAITRTIAFCKILGSQSASEHHALGHISSEYNDSIWRQLGLSKGQVRNLESINLVSVGTSWHAARIAQLFFEILCKIPTRVYIASEFRYMPLFTDKRSLYIMISQSGETTDTLEALRLVNSCELPTVAITNVASSSMVREASGFLPIQAGPEVAIASTKGFSTQIAVLFWLANRMALERNMISADEMRSAEEDLFVAAEVLEAAIEMYKFKVIQELAPRYAKYNQFILLGRHISYPFAQEAAMKLKSPTNIFSQCLPAGELKHVPPGFINTQTPIMIFSVLDDLVYHALIANAHEVKSMGAPLIVFAFEGQDELIKLADTAFILPPVTPLLAPLAMTGIMQFFVYQIVRLLNPNPPLGGIQHIPQKTPQPIQL